MVIRSPWIHVRNTWKQCDNDITYLHDNGNTSPDIRKHLFTMTSWEPLKYPYGILFPLKKSHQYWWQCQDFPPTRVLSRETIPLSMAFSPTKEDTFMPNPFFLLPSLPFLLISLTPAEIYDRKLTIHHTFGMSKETWASSGHPCCYTGKHLNSVLTTPEVRIEVFWSRETVALLAAPQWCPLSVSYFKPSFASLYDWLCI